MSIPEFNERGHLPAGVHTCTLDEIQETFGSFQRTDRRPKLFERLKEFVEALKLSDIVESVMLDGSFVTNIDEPSDIDLVLVLKPNHDFAAELPPFRYNVLSRRMVRKTFRFDILVARQQSEELDEYIEFFQQVKEQPQLTKGLLSFQL